MILDSNVAYFSVFHKVLGIFLKGKRKFMNGVLQTGMTLSIYGPGEFRRLRLASAANQRHPSVPYMESGSDVNSRTFP